MNIVQKNLLKLMAKKAAANGARKILVEISEDGEFDAKIIGESEIIIESKTYDFLMNFYNENKTQLLK